MPPEVYSVAAMFAVVFAVILPLTALFEWMMRPPKEGVQNALFSPPPWRTTDYHDPAER